MARRPDMLPAGIQIDFTFYWPEIDRWEGTDFRVEVQPSGSRP
jgi:hypothetical protein